MARVRLVRLCAGLGLALGLTAAGVTTASAHATLISSNPGNGAVLPVTPGHILLQFDVPVNPRLSAADVRDRSGRRIASLTIDSGAGISSLLAVEMPQLSPGVYRLDFTTWDDTDLHQTGGAIVFGIGTPTDVRVAPVVAPGPSYIETGTRWLELAGTALLVGFVAVWLGILPALGRRRPVSTSARNRLLFIVTLSFIAIVTGKAGQLLVAASGLVSSGAASWPDAISTALTGSRFAMLWLAGLGATALLLAAARGALQNPGSKRAGAALVLTTMTLLIVSSATSHGANQDGPDPLLVAVRVVHLGAAGLWVGGLTVLVFLFAGALRGGSPEAPFALAAFRRFTGLAFIAVGLLTVSGLLLVDRGVGSPAQLVTTTYGLTLVAKLIAGAAAIGFGMRHVRLLSPPRGGGVGGPVRLARSVPFEVGTMLVVLWGAAALGATAPAPVSNPTVGPTLEADTTARVDDLVVHTSMRPGRQGDNSLTVDITGGVAALPVKTVQATLVEAGQSPQTVIGRSAGDGRYEFPTARVQSGKLDVAISITRADGTLERTACAWTITPPEPAPLPGFPATPWGPALETAALGLALLLVGALATALVLSRRRALAR